MATGLQQSALFKGYFFQQLPAPGLRRSYKASPGLVQACQGVRSQAQAVSRRTALALSTLLVAEVTNTKRSDAAAPVRLTDVAGRGDTTLEFDFPEQDAVVELLTGANCDLGVSVYPNFVYNAEGGHGQGLAVDQGNGRIAVNFESVDIPSVKLGTATFLGLPLPPPLRIDIVPESLAGFIEKATGKVELKFTARFFFSAGPLYHAPPLFVETILTTEHTEGSLRAGDGQRLDGQGRCRLAGVAQIPPVDDFFMSNFLMLPTDCLAVLPAQFKFSKRAPTA